MMKRVIPMTLQNGMPASGSYLLMLCEPKSNRQIPIVIGVHEAHAIMMASEDVKPNRPMTHELMVNIMQQYGLTLKQVTIDRVLDGIFYATLHISDGFNENTIDSRTTDAVTLAILTDAPILVDDKVIEETSLEYEQPIEENKILSETKQLETELKKCLADENYEKAAEIQKKMDNLKK